MPMSQPLLFLTTNLLTVEKRLLRSGEVFCAWSGSRNPPCVLSIGKETRLVRPNQA
jgi:hypothetical protein